MMSCRTFFVAVVLSTLLTPSAFCEKLSAKLDKEAQDIEMPGFPDYFRVTPDEKKIVTASGLTVTVSLKDLVTGEITSVKAERAAYGVELSPDGKYFSTRGPKGVKLWTVEKTLTEVEGPAYSADVDSLVFTPDSKAIYFGARNYQEWKSPLLGWWITKDAKLSSLDTDHATGSLSNVLAGLDVRNDGKLFVGYRNQGRGFITIERGNGKLVETRLPLGQYLLQIAFIPKTRSILTMDTSGKFEVWDGIRNEGKELFRAGEKDNSAHAFKLSQDGKLVAIGSKDGTIEVRELATGKTTSRFRRHEYGVREMMFSPDNNRLYSLDWDVLKTKWIRVTSLPRLDKE